MKNKTLKDIFKRDDKREFKSASYGCSCGACDERCFGSCDVVKIKQEAIKWYKHFEESRKDALGIKQYEVADKLEGLMGFIIKFFNITEEDLK